MNADQIFTMFATIVSSTVKVLAISLTVWAGIGAAERVALQWADASAKDCPL